MAHQDFIEVTVSDTVWVNPDLDLWKGAMIPQQGGKLKDLTKVIAVQDSFYWKVLLSDVQRRARAKAKEVAAFSDLKVGGVLVLTRNKPDTNVILGWTSYVPLAAMGEDSSRDWHTATSDSSNFISRGRPVIGWYPIGGRYTVRFSVE